MAEHPPETATEPRESEFALIERYFSARAWPRKDAKSGVLLGPGDDCALVAPPVERLAMSIDTFVDGRHFDRRFNPPDIGHRVAAAALSDLAACAAKPLWALLSLTLAEINHDWLSGFVSGFRRLLDQSGTSLVGGNLSRGPLSITVQVTGEIGERGPLLRSGAAAGDHIYVSGRPGRAARALRSWRGGPADTTAVDEESLQTLLRPSPRLDLGMALAGVASSCIDISDGLAADLGHILRASSTGADLDRAVLQELAQSSDLEPLLYGGDDYELCFTVPPAAREELSQALSAQAVPWSPIGVIRAETAGLFIDGDAVQTSGYDHFSDRPLAQTKRQLQEEPE